jgi:hypothetical protein
MTTRLSLFDFAQSKDPKGNIAPTLELLNQLSPVLEDAYAEAGNAPYGNRTVIRTSLPTVATTKLNKGTARSKSTKQPITDAFGIYSGRAEVDARHKDVEGVAAYAQMRADEDGAFREALAQRVTTDYFYGDTAVDEASYDGLAPRMAALNEGASLIDPQVWSMGAVVGGDGCSMFVVDHGEQACKLGFPPATVAGLQIKDLGDISVNDEDGNPMQAGVKTYDWYVGLIVKDRRHMARLANIDLSDALLDSPTQGKIFDKMEQIFSLMPEPGGAQRVIYCPLRLYAGFLKQARSVSNLALSMGEYLKKPTPMLWGYPLRRSDRLSITEATVA